MRKAGVSWAVWRSLKWSQSWEPWVRRVRHELCSVLRLGGFSGGSTKRRIFALGIPSWRAVCFDTSNISGSAITNLAFDVFRAWVSSKGV